MTRLRLAAELAREESTRERALEQVHKETMRLEALVDLLMATVAATSGSLPHAPVRLDGLLRLIIDTRDIEADAAGCAIRLEMIGDDAPVHVDGNEELLRSAIENIVRNAEQHGGQGHSISVRLEASADLVTLTVRDHGPGVSAALLPRLTEAFYRVNATPGPDGLGLGLAIAAHAAREHGGSLELANRTPGLEVRLALPRRSSSS